MGFAIVICYRQYSGFIHGVGIKENIGTVEILFSIFITGYVAADRVAKVIADDRMNYLENK